MPLSTVTFLIFMVNGYLDTGKYDDIELVEVREQIARGSIFPWLDDRFGGADLSLFNPDQLDEVSRALQSAAGGLEGREMRKMWVKNRGLCYLVGLLVELVQAYVEYPDRKPVEF